MIKLSADCSTLIVIDQDGHALFVNFQKQVVITRFNFHGQVTACEFSPDGKFFAVAIEGAKLRVFESPDVTEKIFAPLIVYKKYGNLHSGDIRGITWTNDSRFIVTWSDDLTLKMISLHKLENFLPFTFSGYNRRIVSAFFSQDDERLFTISENGNLLIWKYSNDRSEGAQK